MSNAEKVARIASDLNLDDPRFYGGLELKFEAGKLVYCKKTETISLRETFVKNEVTNDGKPA